MTQIVYMSVRKHNMKSTLAAAITSFLALQCNAFKSINILGQHKQISHVSSLSLSQSEDEAKELMERVKRMRSEIASLEGRTLEEVEQEASNKKKQQEQQSQRAAAEKSQNSKSSPRGVRTNAANGKFLAVPLTAEDQIYQAANAIENAFRDGLTRQTVRFALVPEDEPFNEDRQWPGGAQQMYREAAGPLAKRLLTEIRAPTSSPDATDLKQPPTVTAQDVWDFDGSAIVTAQASTGPKDDVQALVFANTDTKYTKDIKKIDEAMKDRLFLLINPFWRNIDSWGINILAPNAKALAQDIIFDRGYPDTYALLQLSVRGEDCVALKAYPYDWQLYVFLEADYWPYEEYVMRLGETKEEPTLKDFAELMNEREEFKMNKNMRRMQRMMNKDQ